MTLQTGNIQKKSTVRKAYTIDEIRSTIAEIYERKPSYRRIAKEDFDGMVSFGDIQRLVNGFETKDPKKRAAFGLPELGLATVCSKCGVVHVTKRCTASDPNKVTRPKPIQHEHQMQVNLMNLIEFYTDQYPELEYVFAVPNGGKRSKFVAKKMKAEGVRKGVLDLWLPVRRHSYCGCVIELKYGDNTPSADQKKWIAHLEKNDYLVMLLNDIDLALEIFIAFLAGKSQKGNSLWALIGEEPLAPPQPSPIGEEQQIGEGEISERI